MASWFLRYGQRNSATAQGCRQVVEGTSLLHWLWGIGGGTVFSVVVGAVGDLPWPLWIVLEVAAVLLILAAVLTFSPISIPEFELVAVDSGGGRKYLCGSRIGAKPVARGGLHRPLDHSKRRKTPIPRQCRSRTSLEHLGPSRLDPGVFEFLEPGGKAFAAQLDGVEPVEAMLRVKSLAPP